ncbi:MAG: DUF2334 domain-containing protein [Halobacteriota archaeon]
MIRQKTFLGVLIVCMIAFSITNVSAQETGGVGKKYVIFRDDDVGLAPELLPTLKAVNQVHIDEHVPVTLAIVPNPGGGNIETEREDVVHAEVNSFSPSAQHNGLLTSVSLRGYLSSLAANPLFEFAQHGYTHSHSAASDTTEFRGVPSTVQYNEIQQGRDTIRQAFGIIPRTFIPPWNTGDRNTLEAVKALGFTDYCTGRAEYPMVRGTVQGLRIEAHNVTLEGTSSAQLNESFRTAYTATEQFLNDPQRDTLIVTYHFWSFSNSDRSVDWKGVQLLRDYIAELKDHGVFFTRLDRGYTTTAEEYTAVKIVAGDGEKVALADTPSSTAVQTRGLQLPSPVVSALTFGIIIVGIVPIGSVLYVWRRRGKTS